MKLHELFDEQDRLFEEKEEILFEIEQSGGEITEEQEQQLLLIDQEFEKHSQLIMEFPEKIGYIETKLKKEIEDAEEWEKRYYKLKKSREKKKEQFRAWVGKTIRNVCGEKEKIKGLSVTIKDITNPNYRELKDKKEVTSKYQDATFKIPFEIWEEMPDSIKDKISDYQGSNYVNESRAKKADECPDGFTEKVRYNCQFWGLNKLKEN